MSDFLWMTHPATGGVNRFPVDAVEAWQRLGWVECPEPPPVDLAMVEHVPLHAASVDVPDAEPAAAEPSTEATQPKKTTRRRGE